MKKILLIGTILLLSLTFNLQKASAQGLIQDEAVILVQKNYPVLFNIFGSDLANIHANYVFAVDVSGSMKKNAPIVVPALTAFLESLPNGDNVDIIPFGDYAKVHQPGYTGTVSDGLKTSLKQTVSKLYTNPEDNDIRHYTDIPAAMDAINSCLKTYSKDDLNFIFILTDFRNEDTQERQIIQEDLDRIYNDFRANILNVPTKVVTLQLYYDPSWKGYCRPQLEKDVFGKIQAETDANAEYRPVNVTTSEALSSWFSVLKKEIMVERLRAIVNKENRGVQLSVTPDIDIDGNVSALLSWNPNRLYKELQINDISVPEDVTGFKFVGNKHLNELISEPEAKLKLGKLKSTSPFFHNYDGNITTDVDLPTDFDDELQRLQIDKPIPDTSVPIKKTLFTFPLPLWLTALIALLILLYILMVLKAMKRNNQENFTGSIVVSKRSKELSSGNFKKKNVITIPGDLSPSNIPNFPLSLKLSKKKSNAFAFWTEPKYELKASGGVMEQGSKKKTTIMFKPRDLKNKQIYCGTSAKSDEYNVQFKKK